MRRFLSKKVVVWMIVGSVLLGILYLYTTGLSQLPSNFPTINKYLSTKPSRFQQIIHPESTKEASIPDHESIANVCLSRDAVSTQLDTTKILPSLNFDAPWMSAREYWSNFFEKRYRQTRKMKWAKKPLEVIIMPHSHNDPGWLKTLEGYYTASTKEILNNAVDKLTKYGNLTFVWTEMQFLAMWWSEAHETRKNNLRKLVKEGRFEILTGGWVMTDEANVDVFAMVDQLIEGHSWVQNTFGIDIKSSWSVDPFGHGGTFPYLLNASGIDGMVIMRIHYAWKEYFAKSQTGDFLWTQRWNQNKQILCHNFPYDIYSVKGSCGPKADVCVQFNFASKLTEQPYNEYVMGTKLITPSNVQERAELLLESYGRTGSLHDHNVVLVPLGEDFLYAIAGQLDAQYTNYKYLMDYINQRFDKYHARLRFGTLSDYFDAVRERTQKFPTLNGDFFVYSDIFSSGYPAYWSGYFTTRPYMKQLSRELEGSLRAAEILYSLSYKDRSSETAVRHYKMLSFARQRLALFQHHDAITGTAKQHVMYDYGKKMFESLTRTYSVQIAAIERLMRLPANTLNVDFERDNYQDLKREVPLDVSLGDGYLMVFNPLANDVVELVSFMVEESRLVDDLCIVDPVSNENIRYQVNPTTTSHGGSVVLDMNMVEVVFMARLPALSIQRFHIYVCSDEQTSSKSFEKTQVFCQKCPSLSEQKKAKSNLFVVDKFPNGVPQLESYRFKLTFDPDTKLLSKILDKISGEEHEVNIEISAYPTSFFDSGAYLFSVDQNRRNEKLLDPMKDVQEVIIVSGKVYTELSVYYQSGTADPKSRFVHMVRLYHRQDSSLSHGIYIENSIDLGESTNNRDMDVFMRIKSNIRNGQEFFTDQNGFQMQRRKIISKLEVPANIYPITTMAYIQDVKNRLSLVVDHAAAATSWNEGWLEVIMDRRASHDDARGMGEGVLDNEDMVHKYWLLMESRKAPEATLSTPSKVGQFLSRRLNYPSHQYVGKFGPREDKSENLVLQLMEPLSCDLHLFNLRSTPHSANFFKPGNASLLMLHAQSSESDFCLTEDEVHLECDSNNPSDLRRLFKATEISKIQNATLTGGKLTVVQDITKPEPMAIETFRVEF